MGWEGGREYEQVGEETESGGGGVGELDMGKVFVSQRGSPYRFPSIHNALTAKNASCFLVSLLVAKLFQRPVSVVWRGQFLSSASVQPALTCRSIPGEIGGPLSTRTSADWSQLLLPWQWERIRTSESSSVIPPQTGRGSSTWYGLEEEGFSLFLAHFTLIRQSLNTLFFK